MIFLQKPVKVIITDMKLTATQLRQIIKEEVMSQAAKKKSSSAKSKFDAALSKHEDGNSEFSELVDLAISALDSGKRPLAVVNALQDAAGNGRDFVDIQGIVDAVAEKNENDGKMLNKALDIQYGQGTVGYNRRHGYSQ